MSNYAAEAVLKNEACVDGSKFTKKSDLAYLRSNADKLYLINWKMYQVI